MGLNLLIYITVGQNPGTLVNTKIHGIPHKHGYSRFWPIPTCLTFVHVRNIFKINGVFTLIQETPRGARAERLSTTDPWLELYDDLPHSSYIHVSNSWGRYWGRFYPLIFYGTSQDEQPPHKNEQQQHRPHRNAKPTNKQDWFRQNGTNYITTSKLGLILKMLKHIVQWSKTLKWILCSFAVLWPSMSRPWIRGKHRVPWMVQTHILVAAISLSVWCLEV